MKDLDLSTWNHEDSKGIWWPDFESMVLSSEDYIGFCGCGIDGDLEFILTGLDVISISWPERQKLELEHFGSDIAAQFFYKWCNAKELTEHGGSVPGWLSDKGRDLKKAIKLAIAQRGSDDF